MTDWVQLATEIGSFVLGGGGTGYGVFRYFSDRKRVAAEVERSDADVVKQINMSAVTLLAPAREQVQFLRHELGEANKELVSAHKETEAAQVAARELTTEVEALRKQVEELSAQVAELVAENHELRSNNARLSEPKPAPRRRGTTSRGGKS